MLTSLHWILNTISQLVTDSVSCNNNELSALKKPRLLELYCGCGAHTIPIAKSSILSQIVAVELDERLVTACRNNCILNDCLHEEGRTCSETDGYITKVSVVKEDAAVWAKKSLSSNNKQNTATAQSSSMGDYLNSFDILLVDPPRDGLDKAVCHLALTRRFQHIIYVSCGRSALLRDLDILCMGGFDVADMAVIDLFPGTNAVESLVHMRRRL
jgi:23S rRNA (uracil1939-C5)-methyltransferase